MEKEEKGEKDNIFVLTEKNFDKSVEKGDWVVDFWAEWCSPCKVMEPHFKAAAKELKGKVKFGKVDVEAEFELAGKFNVLSIPTTLYLKDSKHIDRIIGAVDKNTILKKIKESF